jgi:putative endonuclease
MTGGVLRSSCDAVTIGAMVTRDGIIAVYIVASRKHGTLYIGVTSDLARRAYEHREGAIPGFSKDHGCTRLVWWQAFDLMTEAIHREKRMKEWPRDWKTNLIERDNPNWDDLYGQW